jgi:hypothetical protein
MAKTMIQIVIDANNKATAKIRELGEELEDVGGAAKDAGGAFDTFGAALSAAAIVGAGKAVYELAELGAQSLRTGDAFRNISGGAELAEENLDAMRRATRGAMSETEMMARASAMLQMGIATNADELARNAEMAIRLGNAMGTEAGPAMENWNMMIANKSIQRLDTYGISSGNVTKLMGELKEEIEGLSSEEAFRMAVFEEGEKALARLGPIVEDDALAFEKATARAADYRTELAERLAPEVAALINTGLDLLTWNERMGETFRTHADDVIVTAQSYAAYEAELERAAKAAGYVIDEQGNLLQQGRGIIETNYLVAESVYDATHALDGWTATIGEGYNQAELMRAGLGGIAETAGSTVEEVDKLNEASNRVARSFGEFAFDDETLWKMALASGANVDQLAELAKALHIASDSEIQMALEGQRLSEMIEGGVDPREVASRWHELRQAQLETAAAAAESADEWENQQYGMRDAEQSGRDLEDSIGRMARALEDTESITPNLTEDMGELSPTLDDNVEKLTTMSEETGLVNDEFVTMSDDTIPAIVDSFNDKLHPSMRLIAEDAGGIAGSVKNINLGLDKFDGRRVTATMVLNTIGTSAVPGYQHGTPYVPETGLALLHKGEAVLPPVEAATYRQGGNSTTWTGDIVVNGATDPAAVAARVRRELEDRGLIPRVGLR